MKTNRTIISISITVVVLAGLWLCWPFFAPVQWKYAREFKEANAIIAQVEQYRKERGSYPANLKPFGIDAKETGPFYYTLQNAERYTLHFSGGKCFFCCQIYDSASKQWYESD
jgi:hypothetical protein